MLNVELSAKDISNDKEFIDKLLIEKDMLIIKERIVNWITDKKLGEQGIDNNCFSGITDFLKDIYETVDKSKLPQETKTIYLIALLGSIMELWGKSISVKEEDCNKIIDNTGKHIDEIFSDKFSHQKSEPISREEFRFALFSFEDIFKSTFETFDKNKKVNGKSLSACLTSHQMLCINNLKKLKDCELAKYIKDNLDDMFNMVEKGHKKSDIRAIASCYLYYVTYEKMIMCELFAKDLTDEYGVKKKLGIEKEQYERAQRFFNALEKSIYKKKSQAIENNMSSWKKLFRLS